MSADRQLSASKSPDYGAELLISVQEILPNKPLSSKD